MKIVIIYDSANGNTEQIARAIAGGFGTQNNTDIFRAGAISPEQIKEAGLVIIGSPTYGGRPTPAMLEFLNKLSEPDLKGINVAAFDTRLTSKLVCIFGYAAGKIAGSLKKKGGNLIVAPEGFFVKGSKGPLAEGEPERAANWARGIVEAQKAPAAAKTG